MNDLISREEVIKCIELRNEGLMHDEEYRKKRGDIDLLGVIPSIHNIPSVDIMKCARAIKEYCRDREDNLDDPCEGCPFHFYMGYRGHCRFKSFPSEWDLPESEDTWKIQ